MNLVQGSFPASWQQRGVALAILLWFIAALTLLVSSLVMLAKTDSRYAKNYTGRMQAQAVGDGAIQLILAASPPEGQSLYLRTFQLGGLNVHVRAIPENSLIGIAEADTTLLVALFQYGAGLEHSVAAELAQSVVQWRTLNIESQEAKKQGKSIRVVEDILAVPGLNREIFDAIQPLIQVGSSSFNPTFAPIEVLQVYAAGQQSLLDEWNNQRLQESSQLGLTEAKLKPQPMRVDARVEMPGGVVYERSAWVKGGGGSTGWTLNRRMPVKVVSQLMFDRQY